jgi:uncharacterized protein (DUF952 family)
MVKRMILHLVAKAEWDAKRAAPDQPYVPDAFAKDGFIHCTQGDDLLLQVANRFYNTAPGEFLVLSIDEMKVQAPVKWEAGQSPQPTATPAPPVPTPSATLASTAMPPEAKAEFGEATSISPPTPPADSSVSTSNTSTPVSPLFPHIHGPLNREAIVGMRRLLRTADGTFTGFAPLEQVEQAPSGMNLKSPSQLANELVDATGDFSDALSRYKDRIQARMDEIDKNIKDKLG